MRLCNLAARHARNVVTPQRDIAADNAAGCPTGRSGEIDRGIGIATAAVHGLRKDGLAACAVHKDVPGRVDRHAAHRPGGPIARAKHLRNRVIQRRDQRRRYRIPGIATAATDRLRINAEPVRGVHNNRTGVVDRDVAAIRTIASGTADGDLGIGLAGHSVLEVVHIHRHGQTRRCHHRRRRIGR